MTFLESLQLAVLGWPGIALSVILTLGGLAAMRWQVVAAGAVASLPFAYYLGAQPRGLPLAILLPCLVSAGAVAVYFRRFRLAWFLVLPVVVWIAFFALMVLG